jgi:hypothetical protein
VEMVGSIREDASLSGQRIVTEALAVEVESPCSSEEEHRVEDCDEGGCETALEIIGVLGRRGEAWREAYGYGEERY